MKRFILFSILASVFAVFANAAPLTVPATLEADLIATGTNYGTAAINVVVGIAMVVIAWRMSKKFFG